MNHDFFFYRAPMNHDLREGVLATGLHSQECLRTLFWVGFSFFTWLSGTDTEQHYYCTLENG